MTRIFLDFDNKGIGQNIFDDWYSYRQAQLEHSLSPAIKIVDRESADIKIKVIYMPDDRVSTNDFDMIFICNGGEPYSVASPLIKDLIQDPKIFMITNAYHQDHMHLGRKNVWYPEDVPKFQRYCTDGRYPQFYEVEKFSHIDRCPSMMFINGQNRSWRHHFFTKLLNKNLAIQYHSALGEIPIKTLDSQWESSQDTIFRDYVNDSYPLDQLEEIYYSNSVPVGMNQKLGRIPPGYFFLPGYFENSCVIFPETDWQNDFLVMTEKSLKCFYTGCLPFPIGGAGVNYLYNELGLFTAWNLLPAELQKFDQEKNHDLRYDMAVDAIEWLQHNPQVWSSDLFIEFTRINKEKFLTCAPILQSVKKFDRLLREELNI